MRRSIVLVVATMLLAGCTLARGLTSTTCPSSRRRLPQAAAAYLDPGTAVYAVRGYRPSFRLAARREGKPVLFEAAENPRAGTRPDERRADLLPGGRDGDLPRLRPALPPARLPLPRWQGC
jgi:hypothetical protein